MSAGGDTAHEAHNWNATKRKSKVSSFQVPILELETLKILLS